ncbi:MAG: squalene/phytoene synthase family protein [Gemmatimonadota bacterium]
MSTLEHVLRATSRTFAIGIEALSRPLQEEMRIAYLILRVSDYLEDNTTLGELEKAELLDSWAATLQGGRPDPGLLDHLRSTEDPSPDAMAAHHASEIIQALEHLSPQAQAVIRSHTRDSTLGMARWVRRGPVIDTEADLDDYMHEVAGRVGYLITELFSISSRGVRVNHPELMALGREFGLALQTVNIVRGIPADIARGWFFVPKQFLPEGIESGEDFLAEGHRWEAMGVVDRLLRKASGHFEAATRYISLLPRFEGRMRRFCLLPFLFGVRTVALSMANPAVLVSEVKLERNEVRRIASRATLFGWSNRWIRRYAAGMGSGVPQPPARNSPAK